jgi:hypothetical protein
LFCRSSHDFRATNGADLILENFTVALQWHSHFWLCIPPKSPQLPHTKKGGAASPSTVNRDHRPASRRPLCVLPLVRALVLVYVDVFSVDHVALFFAVLAAATVIAGAA